MSSNQTVTALPVAGAEQPPAHRFRVETRTKLSTIAAIVAVVLLLVLAVLPLFAPRNLVQNLFFVFTMLALAQYWNLLAGFAGLVSVGQQAYVGLGGYFLFAAVIVLGLDPLSSILVAGVLTAVLAVPTAFVVFRLQGAYFAIGTWVAAEVFRLLVAQVQTLGGGTGTALPRSATSDAAIFSFVADTFGLRAAVARDVTAYWLALIIAVLTLALVYGVLRSRQGLALSAIRDNETAAVSVGVSSFQAKLWVYLVTAFGTGCVGAVIYLQKARISPDSAFSLLDWTAYVIFIVVIGGIGTLEGPILGVLVFYILQDQLAALGTWYLMLLGLLAIVTMRFFPKGLWGSFAERYDIHLFPIRRRLVAQGSHDAKPRA